MDLETLFLSSMVNARRGPLFFFYPPSTRSPPFVSLRTLPTLPIGPAIYSLSFSIPTVSPVVRASLIEPRLENSNVPLIRASLPPRPRQLAPQHNFPFHRLLALYVYRRRCRVQSRVSLWSSGFSRYTVVWLLLIIPDRPVVHGISQARARCYY